MTSQSAFINAPASGKDSELVLGAGGIKGFGHIGLAMALIQLKVLIGIVTGVSVGSIIAAFLTNGYSPEQILAIFRNSVRRRFDLSLLLRCLSYTDPVTFMIGGMVDVRAAMEDLVRQYGLKPNANLRIISYDYFRQQPVVFEGEDYDLAEALTASCALPTVLKPSWHQTADGPAVLVDGALYHYNPTDFCNGTAIVSAFRPATAWPAEPMLPIDFYFHMRELFFPIAGHRRYVDREKHVLVEIGLPDVAGLNFGLSDRKCLEMVQDGYETGLRVISEDITRGRVHQHMAAD